MLEQKFNPYIFTSNCNGYLCTIGRVKVYEIPSHYQVLNASLRMFFILSTSPLSCTSVWLMSIRQTVNTVSLSSTLHLLLCTSSYIVSLIFYCLSFFFINLKINSQEYFISGLLSFSYILCSLFCWCYKQFLHLPCFEIHLM